MDWNIRLNLALDYIEDNLGGEIDFDYAARLAFCNRNDLSNIFFVVTGVQLNEYVRRRRLSLAALELQNNNEKIIDIAIKYGYSSPTAFNRAFQNQHKASPQYARSRKIFISVYPGITFQIEINGEIDMKCKIEKKPAFKVVGIKKTFCCGAEENLIPCFWRDLPQETYDKIIKQAGGEPKGLLGLCANFNGEHTFDYYIAASTLNSDAQDLEEVQIPEATWAVFESEGNLTALINRIWKEWYPSSGYKRASNSIPDVEVYFDYDFMEMSYDKFSGERSKTVTLKANTEIKVEIVTNTGKVALSIVDEAGNRAYKGNALKTGSFSVTVDNDADYTIKVVTKSHEGSYKIAWK